MIKKIRNISLIFGIIMGFVVTPVYADVSVKQNKIIGFNEPNVEDEIIYQQKGSELSEVTSLMPDKLIAYFEDGSSKEIDVHWQCVSEDYEMAKYYCYQFYPQPESAEYTIAENFNVIEDGPKEFVCFGEELFSKGELSYSSENAEKNADKIVRYLTNKAGLSISAAVGVLANIYYESGCIADIMEDGYKWNTGAGYGICQWTNYPRTSLTGRRTDLLSFCYLRGYSYKKINPQLEYLYYELTTSYNGVLNELKTKGYDNINSTDAFEAARIWCTKFEMPSDAEKKAIERGNYAKTLLQLYSDNTSLSRAPSLSGATYPDYIKKRQMFTVKGYVWSPSHISRLRVYIKGKNGKIYSSKSVNPDGNTYNLDLIDDYITFDKLASGIYYYRVSVTNQSGNFVLLNKDFVVTKKTPVIVRYNTPEAGIKNGNSFIMSGNVYSSVKIKNITVGIYKSKNSKKYIIGSTKKVNDNVYDIANYNKELKFSKLNPGIYYYKISVKIASGNVDVLNVKFKVNA